MTDQPLDLSLCPVCGHGLEALRCCGPKGCGRAFEMAPITSQVEARFTPGAQSLTPADLAPAPSTRTAMGAEGVVRRVRVWR